MAHDAKSIRKMSTQIENLNDELCRLRPGTLSANDRRALGGLMRVLKTLGNTLEIVESTQTLDAAVKQWGQQPVIIIRN